MNKVVAIKVEHVSKKYLIGENKNFPTLRDKLVELPRRIFQGPKKSQEYWALKDVSFEVKKGEVVGVIGRNGAGKSTLLKILARITEPTEGRVTMYGRVASMLEVGTGFNPELTGRENIYLNGAIIGMTKAEIRAKFDEIVEFSGVGKFLDTPVKHYSSGMYVRLAFAVAAHLDADILLVDEVLAVGDAEFQKKCLGKMSDLAHSGRTVIFISHSASAILSLCDRVIYLENGKVVADGDPTAIVAKYLNSKISQSTQNSIKLHPDPKKAGQILEVSLMDKYGKGKATFDYKDDFQIKVNVRINTEIKNADFGITIANEAGTRVLFSNVSEIQKNKDVDFDKGTYIITVIIEGRMLIPGKYTITPSLHIRGYQDIDKLDNSVGFEITESDSPLSEYAGIAQSLSTFFAITKWNMIRE